MANLVICSSNWTNNLLTDKSILQLKLIPLRHEKEAS